MKPLLYVFFLLTICIFSSCRNEDDDFKDKIKDIISENEMGEKILMYTYKANRYWDTAFCYTSYYQKCFIENKNLMFFTGSVYDIVNTGNGYIIKLVDKKESREYIALVNVTENQIVKMSKFINTEKKQLDLGDEEIRWGAQTNTKTNTLEEYKNSVLLSGSFVLRINTILSTTPTLKVEMEKGDDIVSANTQMFSQMFKGELVDFYINKNDILK